VNRDDLKGSAYIQYRNTIKDTNPLEVLHAPKSVIKKICKRNILTGLQYTYDDIKDLILGLCLKAFPVPHSLSQKVCQPFEYLSVDILDMKTLAYSI
jgi:hypothetical protein